MDTKMANDSNSWSL
jgi:hypothetical protein